MDPETQQQVTFTSQTDSTKSVTINAKEARLIGKNLNSQITTNLTIQGLGTGAIGNISIVTQASGTTN